MPPRTRLRSLSLRTRLLLTVIALLAAVGCAIGVVTTVALQQQLVRQVDDRLISIATRPWDGPGPADAEEPADGAPDDGGPCTAAGQVGPGGVGIGSVNARFSGGELVAGQSCSFDVEDGVSALTAADAAVLAAVPVVDAPAQGSGGTAPPQVEARTVELADGSAYRAVALRRTDGTVVVSGLSLAEADRTVSRIVLVELVAVTVGVALAAVLGSVLVRRDLRPLQRVAATATRVSELPLHSGEVALPERVPAADTDPATEVGQVGAALNRLLDHVDSALSARHASETQVRQFVADASHELRTPLAAIRGYAELTRRRGPAAPAVPDDVVHALTRVESEALRMSVLVDDLLLLARLDAGRPLAAEEVDLTMLVLDAVSDARAASPAHRWRLDLPSDAADAVTAVGDEHRLHQVLANLLANARTHTPPGTTVTTRVTREGAGPSARAVLEVVDDGPGIDPEVLPHVFERFARADTSRSRAAGSTGLGLAIVHAVVTAHGGTVEVDSRPGRTAFRVALPAPAAADAAAPAG